uniref:ARAD1D48444p n=1 Tax=Blastobotrys adeninivorans TaxID=409370 RepID=A0A060TDK4_BLAAD
MWNAARESGYLANFSRGIYSTTVEPTPIPSSELVLPPSDPFTFDDKLSFPKDFMLGVAGSAGQIEGAVADEGRTPTVLEIAGSIGGASNNFVTNENYYLYKQDIARLAAMGVKYYSFSIPWSRILPFVLPGTPVNQKALDHYDDLINTVLEYGMLPAVTLNHRDVPVMFLSDRPPQNITFGGYSTGYHNKQWTEAFVNFGKIVMAHFADRVPVWVTVGEPNLAMGTAQGGKNIMLAHAQLYKFYHDDIKGQGMVGIKFGYNYGAPLSPQNQADLEAVQRYNDINLGCIMNPLLLGENYPDSWIQLWNNTGQDFRLSPEELSYVAGTMDYIGFDAYTAAVISPLEDTQACISNPSHPNWPLCVTQAEADQHGWAIGYRSNAYPYTTPSYFRESLNYVWNTFKKPILVAEVGFPEFHEADKQLQDQLFDSARSVYFRSYLNAMLEAIHYDNVHILGIHAWSFVDNWEFGDFSQHYGLQAVNLTTQQRFYKKSFFDFVDFYRQRSFQ